MYKQEYKDAHHEKNDEAYQYSAYYKIDHPINPRLIFI